MAKRIAWVTGGTGGIGTGICRALADQGLQVVAGYSNKEKALAWQAEQKAAGYDFGISQANVGDFASCQASYQEICETYGPVSVLVNNAGITRDGVMKKMSFEQWDQVLRTNLDSVFNASKACLDGMLEAKFGRIINISSINGEKGQFGQTNYSAAKAGMHGFTKALAQEVASKGITVNTISPGYIATDMIMKIDEEIREKIRKGIPVGRFGTPEDIARTVVFLAAEEASFITGANLSVNGGQYMH
ncbi:acetoacetyl-CoA reductase [Allopseudospirillum japonicum]|uniref:Acetoacetyl-CoA reductase n=1 Tax=Allopseudospirillum japonicum TaxID=64971 RepID=A0A1H6UPM6_9GAMM|nr:acetoacetyl-CoA reductase [Allopseudospirillum japonicum]SEI94208.1 acetoacetyl-CoA reductase [Allopseudospirillum japonicum]